MSRAVPDEIKKRDKIIRIGGSRNRRQELKE